jgi:hypothetical protein
MIDPAITWTASLMLVAIFAASAIMKFADLDEFRVALENYRIIPAAAPMLMILIPIAEIASAVGIAIPATRVDGAALLLALIVIFSAAVAINLLRGRVYIDCGCFGPALRQKISWWIVARNAMLAILTMLSMIAPIARPLEALDAVTIALGAAAMAILYATANFLLANAPRVAALEMSDV